MSSTQVSSSLIDHVRSWMKKSSMLMKISIFLLGIYLSISLIIPVINLIFPTAIKHIVFMHLIKQPSNLSSPEAFGLKNVHNFYLLVEPDVQVGVWHYRSPLVDNSLVTNTKEDFFQYFLSTSSNIPIVIYLHGNAFDRSLTHRRELCQKLRDELKYDVFALDYRGFGDSSGEPTEKGVVADARFLYSWLRKVSNNQRRIYVWGHSLGSGIATKLVAQLSNPDNQTVAGLIIEAPFVDVHQAILTHWISLLFRWQPWYSGLADAALRRNKLYFLTHEHLAKVNCPTVMLHADDDFTVPYIHSKQLLKTAINIRDDHRLKKKFHYFQIDMISFHGAGYGHRLIYQAPNLISALKRVVFEENF